MDTLTTTTSTSWFQRLGGSVMGIPIGIVLVLVAVVLLFWNEGRAVKTARALEEGAGIVQTVDPAGDLSAAEGTLIHFSGTLIPDGIAVDHEFDISAPEGSAGLERTVEMYQWRQTSKSETTTRLGGSEETITTYSYDKVWSETPIDSSDFKQPQGHQNPEMAFESRTFPVESASVGGISLEPEIFDGLGELKSLPTNEDLVSAVQAVVGPDRTVTAQNGKVLVRAGEAGNIGDLRVGYAERSIDQISVVGLVEDGWLRQYRATNGNEILLSQDGTASAQQMFDDAVSDNNLLTWILRAVGFVLMFVGFCLVFSVIGVAGDVVPFIGSLLRFATGVVAFTLAAFGSLMIIAIAWFWYRPLLSLALIGAALLIGAAGMALTKSRSGTKAAEIAARASEGAS